MFDDHIDADADGGETQKTETVPKPPGQISLSVLSLPLCGQELKRFPAVRSSHQHDNHNQNEYHHHYNCHHGPT